MWGFGLRAGISVMTHFSNQFEGSDALYGQFQQRAQLSLPQMCFADVVRVLQLFYNVKRGSLEFVKSLLERSECLLQAMSPEGSQA